ncbi:hypothetical protein SH2C18_20100 [Clostridium sediminicola]|uniref:ImmA/IrrE family metallo-endopeptidase n=1 Tax=Clostridium sediminicola TaxID=3114879 RepID=UPI0031F208E9
MTPNYKNAIIESIKTLQTYGINSIPIDLDIIIKNLYRTVRVCSYSKFSKKFGKSISEICVYFDSELGACAYNKTREHYIIYYNDTKNNPGLKRFTIAHELGHILLKHHHDASTELLLRKNISQLKYKRYENEANCFARNLLCPVPLVSTDIPINDIMKAFDISYSAAKTRLNFYEIDNYRMTAEFYTYFESYTIPFKNKYTDNNININFSSNKLVNL